MTNREFYEAVLANTNDTDLATFATEAIAKLDATNAKRATKNAEKREANVALAQEIVASLGDEPMTASDLGEKFSISAQKVSAILRAVDGFEKVSIKIDGKKRVGYVKA